MTVLKNLKLSKGFTLIELLIVIAVLGLLAIVILIALNPIQQLARTRDAGRRSSVTQLGHSMEAYGTSHNGVYVPTAGCTGASGQNWVECLVGTGDISVVPAAIAYTAGAAVTPTAVGGCTIGGAQEINDYCYAPSDINGLAPVIVYARLESLQSDALCTTGTDGAYVAWASVCGRGGTLCRAADPAIGSINTPGECVGPPGGFVD